MEVYCQRTEANERLCSIMSAVLARSLRQRFNEAIVAKQKLLADTNIATGSRRQKSVLRVVLVGNNRRGDLELLTKWIPQFAFRYDLQVSFVDVAEPLRYNDDETNRKDSPFSDPLEALRREETHHPIVFVGLEQSGTELIYDFLTRRNLKERNNTNIDVLGVISIHPMAVPFFWTVPLFVVLQSSSLLSGELRKCLTNPRFVAVVSPYETKISQQHESISLESNQTAALWMVRVVAKYAEAAMSVYRHQHPSLLTVPSTRSRL